MSISFTRYVDISSGLLSSGTIPGAVLELRLITDNPLTPTQTILQFDNATQVGEYYGTTSVEYLQAAYYFSYTRQIFSTSPSSISFAFWPQTATAPLIFGTPITSALSQFTAVMDGCFILTLGPDTFELTGIDFSAAASLTDVAFILESAIQAAALNSFWSSCNVVFDDGFDFTGGAVGEAPVAVQPGVTGTDISSLIGWVASAIENPVFSYGADAITITAYLAQLIDANDNFGSLSFTFDVSTDDTIAAATFFAQNAYQIAALTARTTAADVSTYVDALAADSGRNSAFTLYDDTITTQYPWLLPAAIVASINFNQANTVTNFQFKYNGTTPTVTDDTTANFYDNLRINYVGQTQKNGAIINFYQRGYAIGTDNNNIVDLGVMYNEMWLNKTASAAVGNVLLDIPSVPANQRGIALVTGALQNVIDQALFNGVISVGNIFSESTKVQIATLTNDPDGWIVVQTDGYYLSVFVTEPSPNVFEINYLLVYGKNNSVRKIVGTHAIA